ncbi:lipoprotein [Spiroplasma endosymbiont of Dioctria linearis]|uniref:lipoprotein n=1 Tax=Spiroplasma endosymbiont of Dioctria linearis TaxID=3066290 RepID=UPI00313E6744
MKKLLSLLAAFSLVTTSSVTVVSCGDKTVVLPIIEDNSQLIKELKTETNEIFKKHLKNNVYKNLISLPEMEVNNKFLTKNKINQYQGKTVGEIDSYDLQKLEIDMKKVLDINELTKSLNQLKNVNKYKILLNDVDSLIKNVIFDWESLVIKSYEKEKIYLGNVIVDYKIEVQYKGVKDIETFNISDNFKYTSTNNEALKKGSDDFYKGIAKDYFSSEDALDKKHTNLKWNKIKDSKDESDGYGTYETEFKKYYQEAAKTNGFETSMTNFIKNNYFSEISSTLPLSFEGDLIYKSSDMNKYSLFKSINTGKSYNDSNSIKLDYKTAEGRIMLNTVFRNDPNKSETQQALVNSYFTNDNYKVWEEQYKLAKENFLKELSIDKESSIVQTNEFKSSLALGYVNLTGLSINLADGGYIHELPDFRIAVNYLIDVEQSKSKILDNLAKFSVNSLKVWHKTMGVVYGYEYPEYNSAQDFLMVIKSSKLTNEFVEKSKKAPGWGDLWSAIFNWSFGLSDRFEFTEDRLNMLNQAKLPEDSMYTIGFQEKNFAFPASRWTWTDFDWITEKNGLSLKWHKAPDKEITNNNIMLWDLGYINFYIDLDQITLGCKTLGQKDFIKFI